MDLENLADLKHISKGPTRCVRLQNLENLEVREWKFKIDFLACNAEGPP